MRLLQGFRKRVVVSYPEDLPFSVLRFPLQIGKDESYYFQSRHAVHFPGMAVQMGRVGVVSVFDDFEAMERRYAHNFGAVLDGHALHPVQFWELAGRLLYVASLYSYRTSFELVEGKRDISIAYMPVRDHEGKYSEKECGRWAQEFSLPWARVMTGRRRGLPFYNPKTRKPITFLMKPDRSFNEMPVGDELF